METLPPEVIWDIVKDIHPTEIQNNCRVNKRLQAICNDPAFREFYKNHWGIDFIEHHLGHVFVRTPMYGPYRPITQEERTIALEVLYEFPSSIEIGLVSNNKMGIELFINFQYGNKADINFFWHRRKSFSKNISLTYTTQNRQDFREGVTVRIDDVYPFADTKKIFLPLLPPELYELIDKFLRDRMPGRWKDVKPFALQLNTMTITKPRRGYTLTIDTQVCKTDCSPSRISRREEIIDLVRTV